MKPIPVVLAITALLGAAYVAIPVYEDERVSTPLSATPAPVAQATPAPVAQAPAPVAQAPQASLSARVDALTRGRPVDAFEAYKILAACATKQAPCEDISPGQIASRRVALQRAAHAGVHGATMWLMREGPDDYNLHGINEVDPVSKEWVRQVRKGLEAGARTGERFSIMALAQSTESEDKDLVAALKYWAALAKQTPTPGMEKEIARRAKELPPDVAAKAIAEGHMLAASFKPEGEQQ
jgi:hypothetical protein